MPSHYTVINASAGSGKTYALVQRLLSVCLKYPNQPDAIRHILALTFTNKAANEMKLRILSWLKAFTDDNYVENNELKNIQEKLQKEGTNVTLDDLHQRSKNVLDYILHHYSTLNISTIDKFNSRLVRSFSYELGLPQNFNLEIQAEPFLIEAVDKMLDEIGEEQQISEAFMDFVSYSLENNERVSLSRTLYDSAKEFVQDKHYFQLHDNKDFSWDAYENGKQKLRKEIQELKKESVEINKMVLQLLQEKSLEIGDFSGGSRNSIAKFFFEIEKYLTKERKDFPFPSNEESAQNTFLKGASSIGKNRESGILEILDFLLENRKKLITNHILSQKKEKILRALLPLKVNKEVQDKLAEIEEENDLVLLSKFNVMIHENLREEPSAFIYEKVGTQFSHYFFDEFQDTSKLQWQNFLPLRDHTITSDNTSFTIVGDPKQSIYRFRGGESKMMLDIIHHKEESPIKANIELLDTNWRSSRSIVRFNNDFYHFLSRQVNEEHRDIFGTGSQQKVNAKFDGRVRINLIENGPKAQFFDDVTLKMQNDIQQCLDNGYSFSDITILCRGNHEIFMYSQLLGNMKVNYHGEETYIKTISDKGLTLELSSTLLAITEYLRWELNPKNSQFLIKMMYYLNLSGKIHLEDFTSTLLELLDLKSKSAIEHYLESNFGIRLHQTNIPHLNLYNYIEYYVQEFLVEGKETDYLLNFLEMVFNFSQNAGFSQKDFLKFWDEEGRTMSVQTSENIDAIQIITIHKSKGLEFPIVFLPMENKQQDGKFSGWLNTNEEQLNSVIISPFDSKLEEYDADMQNFNQEHAYQNKIDRFCLLYVATTRAVEQMFFYIEKPNKTSNHLEIYDFVMSLERRENEDSFDVFLTDENILQKQKENEQRKLLKTKRINKIGNQQQQAGSITIATPSKAYQQRNEKVRMGIFMHEVLAKINTEKDIQKVLKSYVMEGNLTSVEEIQIKNQLLNFVKDARYADYFKEGLTILNEQEIMIFENETSFLYRPDRIIDSENGCIIIDFKTGAEKDKDKKQIENYKSALERLGKKVLKTELIYL